MLLMEESESSESVTATTSEVTTSEAVIPGVQKRCHCSFYFALPWSPEKCFDEKYNVMYFLFVKDKGQSVRVSSSIYCKWTMNVTTTTVSSPNWRTKLPPQPPTLGWPTNPGSLPSEVFLWTNPPPLFSDPTPTRGGGVVHRNHLQNPNFRPAAGFSNFRDHFWAFQHFWEIKKYVSKKFQKRFLDWNQTKSFPKPIMIVNEKYFQAPQAKFLSFYVAKNSIYLLETRFWKGFRLILNPNSSKFPGLRPALWTKPPPLLSDRP